MGTTERKEHWENIYTTKELTGVSWYQPTPQVSLNLIHAAEVSKNAPLIDVGGGDSFLADYLLELEYTNISVLDISAAALQRAKARLGTKASEIQWIVSDSVEFKSHMQYDLWHDRAAFHFLTDDGDIQRYVSLVNQAVNKGGTLILGTFSEDGPTKCSGIGIRQYSETSISQLFEENFERVESFYVDHHTPFDTIQNFVFCRFRKKQL